MSGSRRLYTLEFKREALALVTKVTVHTPETLG